MMIINFLLYTAAKLAEFIKSFQPIDDDYRELYYNIVLLVQLSNGSRVSAMMLSTVGWMYLPSLRALPAGQCYDLLESMVAKSSI